MLCSNCFAALDADNIMYDQMMMIHSQLLELESGFIR